MSDTRRNLKVSEETLRRLNRIARREQRTQTATLDRIVLDYEQRHKRELAAERNQR